MANQIAHIPSMFRVELLHPFSVHFPIALLLLVTLLEAGRLLFAVLRHRAAIDSFPISHLLLLSVGVASAWLAVYFGGLAEDVVNRIICDPTITHQHEDRSYLASYAYSTALALALLLRYRGLVLRYPACVRPLFIAQTAALFLGGYFLLQAAHLGASLVYLQGAAVYHPTAECSEFSD